MEFVGSQKLVVAQILKQEKENLLLKKQQDSVKRNCWGKRGKKFAFALNVP